METTENLNPKTENDCLVTSSWYFGLRLSLCHQIKTVFTRTNYIDRKEVSCTYELKTHDSNFLSPLHPCIYSVCIQNSSVISLHPLSDCVRCCVVYEC